MTNTPTRDVQATLAQIHELAEAGCDLIRVAVPTKDDTAALGQIVRESPIPVIADVHFHFRRALEAVEAGAAKIRLNPGNIADRQHVLEVIEACKRRNVPIRVGVNEASIVERRDSVARSAELKQLAGDYRHTMVELMLRKLTDYVEIFRQACFDQLVLSVKSSDARLLIAACLAVGERFDYPLHLGLTHAGPPETGRIRSVAALGALLSQGIGNTIRISYASHPIEEVLDARELLCSLGLRARTEPELIACPTCGRIQVDLVDLVQRVRRRLAGIKLPMRVAVMGCVVNGPGEAEGADVALSAGNRQGIITVQGRHVCTVAESEMLDALYEQCVEFAERVRSGQAKLAEALRYGTTAGGQSCSQPG
jgi:(E)-4-hydroxy-3-methylbut-2-enyl-diphosphate synthase